MSRPPVPPDWATGSTYSAGTYPGQANKNQPPAGNVTEGFDPGAVLPASWLNFILNNDGNWIDYIDNLLVGTGFYVPDDFVGPAIDGSKWTVTGPAGLTFPDDSANGGFGVARMHATAGTPSVQINTNKFALGTRDFVLAVRWRNNVALNAGNPQLFFGINDFGLQQSSGGTVWQVYYDVTNTFNTALSPTDVTNYHSMQLARLAGTLYMYIDGTLVHSVADTFNSSGQQLIAQVQHSATDQDVYFDYFKLWINR